MDTVTHLCLGACLGEIIAGKQLGKKAWLCGAVISNLPDLDVACHLWASPSASLLLHRGFSHSFLCLILLSPLLALAGRKLFHTTGLSYLRWLLLSSSSLLLHLLTDALTGYGIGWLEPFSPRRVSFNCLYIFDPFFSVPLWLACAGLFTSRYRKTLLVAGLCASGLYLSLAFMIKHHVSQVIRKDLETRQMSYLSYLSTPTPMNTVLWYVVVNKGADLYTGYYSIFDRQSSLNWETVPRQDSLLVPLLHTREVQDLQRFSEGYYCLQKKDSLLLFSDMRFGQNGGWHQSQAPFVFNFVLERKAQGRLNLQQGRLRSFRPKELQLLIHRARGI